MSENKSVFPPWTENIELRRPPKTWGEPEKLLPPSPFIFPDLRPHSFWVILRSSLTSCWPGRIGLLRESVWQLYTWMKYRSLWAKLSNIHSTITILGFSSTGSHVFTQPTCKKGLYQSLVLARSLRELKTWHAPELLRVAVFISGKMC